MIEGIELLKAIPFTLFLLLLIGIIGKFSNLKKREVIVVGFAFIIRATLAILLSHTGFGYFFRDPIKYDDYALLVAKGYLNFDAALNVKVHSFVGGVIYYLFGHSPAVWAVFNAFIGALTVIVIIKIAKELFGTTEANILSILYAVFPSYVLFSALIQREVVVIFFITLSIFYFIRYLKENRMKYLLIFVGFVIIGGLFRPLNAPLFLAIAFPFVIYKIYNSKTVKSSNVLKPFVLLFVLIAVPALIASVLLLTPLAEVLKNRLSEEYLLNVAEAREAGQSVYLPNIKYTSLWSIFYYIPIKFVYFTFGPFIWMVRSGANLSGSLEGLANFMFIVLSWRGIKYLRLKNKSIAFFLLMFAFGSLSAYGVIDSNFGTALRHRISFTFIFVILAGYSLARSKGIFYLFKDIFILRRYKVTRGLTLLFIGSALLFPLKNALSVEKDINKLPYEDDSVRIWSVNSLEKISSHYSISGTKSEFKDSIKINSAKNEYESFQVIISNKTEQSLEINKIDVPDFKYAKKKGFTINRKNIETFYVGYINNEYPDVLFPTDSDKYRNEFREIVKGENCNLWITLYVPLDVKAGEYKGTISLGVDKKPYNIPVFLRVWDFAPPKKTNVKTQLFTIHFKEIESRYQKNIFSGEYERFIKDIFEEYKKHHISPGYTTPVPLNLLYKSKNYGSEYIARYFEKWCKYWTDAGLDCNNIQTPEKIKDIENYYKPIYRIIKKNGWTDRVYIKLPNDEAKKGEKAEENIKWAKVLKEMMPDIKILHTLGGLERGLNRDIFEHYSGYVNIWSFVPNAYFDDKNIRSFMDERIKKGEMMSWYIHRRMNVWQPLNDLRHFFYEMWAHDASMITLWRTNFWSRPAKYKNVAGRKILRVPEKKTWREIRGFGSTKSSGVGNGTLFWPDDDRVLTSIRLEVLRDGIEDYEYFFLAKGKNIKVIVPNDSNSQTLLDYREKIARQIEK
jgi:hypothetical protein